MRKGVNCSSIAEVPCEHNLEAIKSTVCLADGEQVKHGLSWVVSSAVTAVKNWDTSCILGVLCRALPWVTHGDNICITINHLDGVEERFTFDH